MNEYEQQANDFANHIGLSMTATYVGHHVPPFETRKNWFTAQHLVTLSRGSQSMQLNFYSSLNDSWTMLGTLASPRSIKRQPFDLRLYEHVVTAPKEAHFGRVKVGQKYYDHIIFKPCSKPPTLYDVLACLTKYEPGSFEDFCFDYGYDTDSRRAYSTYEAVQNEFSGVRRVFAGHLEQLQEIQ
jgi:hypothetical protein